MVKSAKAVNRDARKEKREAMPTYVPPCPETEKARIRIQRLRAKSKKSRTILQVLTSAGTDIVPDYEDPFGDTTIYEE